LEYFEYKSKYTNPNYRSLGRWVSKSLKKILMQ